MSGPEKSYRYEDLRPQKQNQELNQILKTFPSFDLLFVDLMDDERKPSLVIKEASDRRGNTELWEVLQPRIDKLIDVTPVTNVFRENLKSHLELCYKVGISPEAFETDQEHKGLFNHWARVLLDLENPESGGIFDPSRAKFIERYFYSIPFYENQDSRTNATIKDKIHDVVDFVRTVDIFITDSEFRRSMKDPEEETLKQWRKQYKEKYGENLKPVAREIVDP